MYRRIWSHGCSHAAEPAIAALDQLTCRRAALSTASLALRKGGVGKWQTTSRKWTLLAEQRTRQQPASTRLQYLRVPQLGVHGPRKAFCKHNQDLGSSILEHTRLTHVHVTKARGHVNSTMSNRSYIQLFFFSSYEIESLMHHTLNYSRQQSQQLCKLQNEGNRRTNL
jgi:hypothetical protein